MFVGLVAFGTGLAALGGLLVGSNLVLGWDLLGAGFCSAPDNLPCRPLTLECLAAAAGGLGVAWPAISNEPPAPSYDEGSQSPQANSRQYAPDPPPGYEPPAQRDPREALNDQGFEQARQDWARQNSDRFPTIPDSDVGRRESAYETLVKSIQNKDKR